MRNMCTILGMLCSGDNDDDADKDPDSNLFYIKQYANGKSKIDTSSCFVHRYYLDCTICSLLYLF